LTRSMSNAQRRRAEGARLERENARWVKPGKKVYYHPVVGEQRGSDDVYVVRETLMSSDGTRCAFLRGKAGYVWIAALSPAPDDAEAVPSC
jgi:hypothetical protein